MKTALLSIVLALAISQAYSQRFYALAQAGATMGTPYSGAVVEGAGGFRLRNWQLGISTGAGSAQTINIPLLADVRWTFWRGKTSLGLFSREGWVFAAKQKKSVYSPNAYEPEFNPPVLDYTEEYKSSPYWTGGLFWRIPVKKAGGLLISAGAGYRDYRSADHYPVLLSPDGPIDFPPANLSRREWTGNVMVGWEW